MVILLRSWHPTINDIPTSTWQVNIQELTGWFSSSGREILPEDCVVDVTSTIKLQCRAKADDCAYTVWNKYSISRQLNLEHATNLWGQVLLGTTK